MPFSRWGRGETANGIVVGGSCLWEFPAAKLNTAAMYVEAAAEGFRTRVRLPPPPPDLIQFKSRVRPVVLKGTSGRFLLRGFGLNCWKKAEEKENK